MDLFFNTNARGRRVWVYPWMITMERYYFVVSSRPGDQVTKYSALSLGQDPESVASGLSAIFPNCFCIEDVYSAPVLETLEDVVVWVKIKYLHELPEGVRKVTFNNFKALVKDQIPGLDPLMKKTLTRSAPSSHTRLGGVRKGLETLQRV